jgi:hypothetical protein
MLLMLLLLMLLLLLLLLYLMNISSSRLGSMIVRWLMMWGDGSSALSR